MLLWTRVPMGCDEGGVPELHRTTGDKPMSDINESDVLRNAHASGSMTDWSDNPEPSFPDKDPQTILDTEDATGDAYLWHAMRSSESWLQFDGELADLER